MKFEFNWPSGFRGMSENVDRWTDRRGSHWYANSSPEPLAQLS